MTPIDENSDNSVLGVESSQDEVAASIDDVWTAERLARADYKSLGTPIQVQNRFLQHLLNSKTCRDGLHQLYTSSSSTTTRDYSLEIDSFELIQQDTVLGFLVLKYPIPLLPLLEKAIVQAQTHLFVEQVHNQDIDDERTDNETVTGAIKGDTGVSMTRVHARLVNLPPTCTKTSLNHMEAEDVGKIWQIQGTVVRASPVQMYESARTYRCTGKHGCGRSFAVEADLEQCHNALVKPEHCLLTRERGEPCGGQNLQVVGSVHTDYQEIKIQEAASRVGVGSIPRSLLIKLQHDLVDACQPGDEVVLVGSLLAQWPQNTIADVDCPIGMALKAHSIRVVQEKGASVWNDDDVGEMDRMRKEFDAYWADRERQRQPIAARDFICQAVCPKLYGMSIIKLSLLLTLIGGVSSSTQKQQDEYESNKDFQQNEERKEDLSTDVVESESDEPDQFLIHQPRSGRSKRDFSYVDNQTKGQSSERRKSSVKTRRRDQSHMLLVGDPGTGK